MAMRYYGMRDGDTFLNWNSKPLVFDSNFENIRRKGINAYDNGKLVASITWSSAESYTFLRSAFVDEAYRGRGIFTDMFAYLIEEEGSKPVKGQWRVGGPMEPIMNSWNERWDEDACQ